jgi:hypothetical protein
MIQYFQHLPTEQLNYCISYSVPLIPHDIPFNYNYQKKNGQFPSSGHCPRTLHHEPRGFQRLSFSLQLPEQSGGSAKRGKNPLQQPRTLPFNDGWGFVATSAKLEEHVHVFLCV